ncbi:ABC transporter ATP-binding protein [Thermococcus waiotapuensis]|uniref:ABC transporter ATP-binding protein n=1 Tax=Thermococcus waiotapuensis TaxID=90909 RepID=A0AAE4T0I7_9EURY|nr:ABC transporter ATP-binding protein [Thermococcus waiotapuensis]MDV3103190.1 ABC transporter ATP-binding protein [Thermococcus waiotapuensis]
MLLECSNLSKSYGDVQALKGVTFSLSRGLSLILGPNGSGKTTLIKILAGITKPDGGTLKLLGKNYFEVPRSDIGFAFEKTILPPNVRVEGYLRAVAELRGEDNVDDIIEIFGLGKHRTKRFRELSQGYKRRFIAAMAFAGGPKVVFLDEPFSNVDIIAKIELVEAFFELRKKIDIVIVSHVLAGLKDVDSLVLLHGGQVIMNVFGNEAKTLGGFRAVFPDEVVENDINRLVELIRSGKEPMRIEPVFPEEFIQRKLLGGWNIRQR